MTNNYFELLKLEDVINYLHKAADKVMEEYVYITRPSFKLSVHYADDMGYEISEIELNSDPNKENSFGLNASNKGIWLYLYNKYDSSIREYIKLYKFEQLTY